MRAALHRAATSFAYVFSTAADWASRSSPVRRIARSSIRTRLALIVIAIAVPLNALIIAAIWHLTQEERQERRTGLLYTARSVAAAVDAQLGRYMALGEALSRSPALLDADLGQFEAEARRAFPNLKEAWVLVADTGGQQVMNLISPIGAALPRRNPTGMAAQQRALETRSIVISNLLIGGIARSWLATIEIPILRDGQPFRSLVVSMSAEGFLRLLNEHDRPRNWYLGIVDQQGRFVARVPGHERNVGQPASEGWRRALGLGEGVYEFNSIEGRPLVQGIARSSLSGWWIGIGIEKAELEASAWRTTRWALVAGTVLSLISLLLASIIGRSITSPLSELRQNASVLLRAPTATTESGPPEIVELREALRFASEERDRTEAELRQLADRFTTAEEAAVGFIFEWDAVKDRLWYSPGMARLLGHYLPEPLTRQGWHSHIHPDDLSLLEPITKRQLTPEGRFILEYRVRHKDGHWIWIWHRGQILRGPDGSMRRMIGSVIDISERKRFEAELARQNAEIAALYDTARIGMCVFDRDLRFLRINKRMAEMNGVPAADHIGKTPREVVPALGDAAERLASSYCRNLVTA